MAQTHETGLYYGGAWHQPVEGGSFTVVDPATGLPIGTTALATGQDVDLAVEAARKVRRAWAKVGADRRAALLHRAADLIAERADAIARILTLEQGKPLPDARKEIDFGVEVIRYYAEEGRRIGGSLRPSVSPEVRNVVTNVPVGIVAGIVPWNYPVDLYCWKLAPALAAGCPAIIKPPHETPFAIAEVVRCFEDAGLPAGVLANLPGTGPEAGAALAGHPGIAMISATASIAAGQEIARRAASNLKRLSLELGGHSPFIVMADADIEAAAKAALRRSFSNMGQICIAVNRILVQREVHGRFVEALAAQTDAIRLGHGLDPAIAYGPVLNPNVIARTEAHIADAVAKGGRIVAGGASETVEGLEGGYFFRPTVIDGASLDSLPMSVESFGPLAAVRPFDTLDEMLGVANGLDYGLAAYLYTEDLERGWRIAEELDFGMIGLNVNDTSELQAPFGGCKLSGIGRELGPEGLSAYLEPKLIRMRLRCIA
ncbi:aldehyde dehydrogenase family protein [Sphingomonas oryzagri]|uniref:Aldehyde dehydrogenase family protein n=1 Tax=Sphingomonas oryzagri TaxID=3042314 RepID=A0ABT6MXG6_9SPHN|nr:aldehyde dehydrogenase family protein [Sphingomonas oryzagri]MDH7637681.1 aldehyde dehydrogenase family protein [Sphingomonas oryzagri]